MEKLNIYQVGGSVRDKIIGIESSDKDYVVVGTTIDEMLKLGFKQVGKDFPVFLHPITNEEYALARKEKKNGSKHNEFTFDFNDKITLEDDLKRRDFTCNAIAIDKNGKYIDKYSGIDDIKNKTLRIINEDTFKEDPLRILRFHRFVAQLGFKGDKKTVDVIKQMVKNGELNNLSPERIFGEFLKAIKTNRFEKFILSMKEIGTLKCILPEIEKLFFVNENEIYHKKKSVGNYTLLAIEEGEKMNLSSECIFSILLHNVGKGENYEKYTIVGLPIINSICDRLKCPNKYRDLALMFCKNHIKIKEIKKMSLSEIYDIIDNITKYKDFSILDKCIKMIYCDLLSEEIKLNSENKKYIEEYSKIYHKIFNFVKDKNYNFFKDELINCSRENIKNKIRELRINLLKINNYFDF